MNYKIIINIPNETNPTEVSITGDQMELLEPALNQKRLVKINGSYFNTTYIAKIIPDTEANRLEESKLPKLEQTTQTQSDKNNREAINELKNKLFKKGIVKKETNY